MRVIVAKNRIEEYELRARYFKEDYHLAGRGKRETEFRIRHLVAFLPLAPGHKVLDIGPGNGLLFEWISSKVSECYGIDPSEAMVERLRKKFSTTPNVRFAVARASCLPFPDAMFDTVVISGVVSYLEDEKEVRRSLQEVKRVSKVGARIYIGEVPFVDEQRPPQRRKTVAEWLGRKICEGGVREIFVSAHFQITRRIRQILNREPLLIPSTHGLYFDGEYFLAMCKEYSLDGSVMRTETVHGASPTRNDYVLNRMPDSS